MSKFRLKPSNKVEKFFCLLVMFSAGPIYQLAPDNFWMHIALAVLVGFAVARYESLCRSQMLCDVLNAEPSLAKKWEEA